MWFESQPLGQFNLAYAPSCIVTTSSGPWAIVAQSIQGDAHVNANDMAGLLITAVGSLQDLLDLVQINTPDQMRPLTTDRTEPAGIAVMRSQPNLRLATIDAEAALAARWSFGSMDVFVTIWHNRAIGALYPATRQRCQHSHPP